MTSKTASSKKTRKKTGRPSAFSQAIADRICEQLADGESLRNICLVEGMPHKATVYRWLEGNEAFRDQYTRAREQQADHYAAEIIEIADDGTNDTYETEDGRELVDHEVVARSKLRVDARKWAASKLAPKKYGERTQLEHTGKDGGPMTAVVNVTIGNGSPARPEPSP